MSAYTFSRPAVGRTRQCVILRIGGALFTSMETIKHRILTKICKTECEIEGKKYLLNEMYIKRLPVENHV